MEKILLLLFITCILLSCKDEVTSKEQPVKKIDSALTQKSDYLLQFDSMEMIISHMKNKVMLDSLMVSLTNQKNVRLITQLKESWNDTTNAYVYSADNYYFELEHDSNRAATFKDGNKKLKFASYSLTCPHDPDFKCEDYGFDNDNTFRDSKIIEISGHRFLYADVSYWCNGIGCGCFITFIYDLEKKQPIFLENYRMPFDGFYVSDFDNDRNPDLLVISQTGPRIMKGFNFEEFDVKLSWYHYDKGNFKPKFNNRFQRFYCYELYSFTPFYHHAYHTNRIYSVTKDNWTE